MTKGDGDVSTDRFLCVGAAHWDVIGRASRCIRHGEDLPGSIIRRPGGVAYNIAIALARAGCAAALCAVVGDDDEGVELLQIVNSRGVNTEGAVRSSAVRTGAYVAVEDGVGELVAAVVDGRAAQAPAEAEKLLANASTSLGRSDVVVIDANLPETIILALAHRCLEAGVSMVLNPVSHALAGRLAGAISPPFLPTVVASRSEAEVLTGLSFSSAKEAAIALRRCGARTALVTDGAGVVALAHGHGVAVALPEPIETSTTTGAGDALLAGYLSFARREEDPVRALQHGLAAARQYLLGAPSW
ncbi:MAG: PfkB family carbohydrate kinase [Pseudomonadota bacterium]